jgi:hypothetical protein
MPVSLRTRFATGERLVEAAVEDLPRRAGGGGRGVLLLHLAEDLRLADDHRVEARRDAERVRTASAADVRVEVGAERRSFTPCSRAR